MAETRRYVIRRAVVVPLGLVLLLMGALLVVSILHRQPAAKVVFLVVFALPVTVLFAESALRRVEVDATGITAFRFFRSRRLDFSRITALETVQVRGRVFVTVVAGDDEFLIVTNSYADFPELVRQLVTALPDAAVSDQARQLAAAPPVRHAGLVMVWFAVVALVYVLIVQLRS